MKPINALRWITMLCIAASIASCAPFKAATETQKAAPRPAAIEHAALPRNPVPKGPPEIAALAGLPENVAGADQMVVHYIDVGQGDAELLEFSCAAVLIDSGGETTEDVDGRKNLVDYLEDFFERRPDLGRTLALVVLSHPHIDHTNGIGTDDPAAGLLGMNPQVTIENVVDDGDAPRKASGAAGQKALQAHVSGAHYFGVTEAKITTTAGFTNSVIDPVDCRPNGGLDPKISVLWGRVDPSAGAWTQNENNNSVVVKVEFGAASFLFMGDLEQKGIEAMLKTYSADTSVFDSDVLKVGHHGSKNGTTAQLLQVVTPKIAVIGAGDSRLSHATFSAFSFAHPNKVAIDLLLDQQNGVTLTRPRKTVRVGIKGADHTNDLPPEFQNMTIDRAIYATGWDGNIAVTAKADGTLSVQTGF